MSISSTVRIAGPYSGNGVTTVFAFAFKVFSAVDLLVVLRTSDGVEHVLVLTSDYTVALNANQDVSPGGSITMIVPPAIGETLTATSNLSLLQPTVLTNLGGFFPQVINDALDRLTIFTQQLAQTLTRSITVPLSSTGINTSLPTPQPSTVLGWNAAGDAIENLTGADLGILTNSGAIRFDINQGSLTPAQQQQAQTNLGLNSNTLRTLESFDPVDQNNAMQLAAAWMRAGTYSVGGSQIPQNNRRLKLTSRTGLVTLTQSVNLQGIACHGGWGIDGSGVTVLLRMAGKTGFDLLGSRWGHFVGLNIVGDRTFKPAIGVQVGRLYGPGVSADGHVWDRFTTSGNFTRAAFYNLASETGGYPNAAVYSQQDDAGTGMAFIFDGYNKYGAITDFAAPAISPNTYMSCIQHTFINMDARVFVRGHPIETINADQFEVYGGYSVGFDAGVKIIGSGQGHVWNMHVEPSGVVDSALLFESIGGGIQEMRIFEYKDHASQTVNSPFQKTAGTASVRLIDTKIALNKGGSSTATSLFGTGFSMSGKAFAGSLSLGNMDNFNGAIDATDMSAGTSRPIGSYAIIAALSTETIHKGVQTQAGDVAAITGTNLTAGANISTRNAVMYCRSPNAGAQSFIGGVNSATTYTIVGATYLDFASSAWLTSTSGKFTTLNTDGSRTLSSIVSDPASPISGSEWVNGTANVIKTRQGGVTRIINTTP